MQCGLAHHHNNERVTEESAVQLYNCTVNCTLRCTLRLRQCSSGRQRRRFPSRDAVYFQCLVGQCLQWFYTSFFVPQKWMLAKCKYLFVIQFAAFEWFSFDVCSEFSVSVNLTFQIFAGAWNIISHKVNDDIECKNKMRRHIVKIQHILLQMVLLPSSWAWFLLNLSEISFIAMRWEDLISWVRDKFI